MDFLLVFSCLIPVPPLLLCFVFLGRRGKILTEVTKSSKPINHLIGPLCISPSDSSDDDSDGFKEGLTSDQWKKKMTE